MPLECAARAFAHRNPVLCCLRVQRHKPSGGGDCIRAGEKDAIGGKRFL